MPSSLSQLSRQVRHDDKRPQLSDLRSAPWKRTPTSCCSSTEEYYLKNRNQGARKTQEWRDDEVEQGQVIIAKQRHGPPAYRLGFQEFTPLRPRRGQPPAGPV